MKHVVVISKQPRAAATTDVSVDTKITFITDILDAFKPLLEAKESASTTS